MPAAIKSDLDDEEYDRLSEYAMSGSECDFDNDQTSSTPLTAPSPPHKRPSDIKKLACHYEGCEKTFNRQARLSEHLRSHTNTRPFKCSHCPKDFLRDSHLKHHVKSAHSDIRDYTCSHAGCGKSFATGTRLRRHEATHSGENKHTCTGYDDCNQTFRKKETLHRHILQAHQNIKPFACTEMNQNTGEMCQKRFDTAEKLKSHQRSMHDPTRFTCTICQQAQVLAYRDTPSIDAEVVVPYFATYAGLKRHIDAEHPPTCARCSLSFKTPKELSRHVELVHNLVDPNSVREEEAHRCPYAGCDRSFSKKGNLSVHVRTVHEKRRDFVCGQTGVTLAEITSDISLLGCGRDFTSKSTLEEHIRTTHLGMEAKRVERNKKRRAEKHQAEDEDKAGPKKRRTRKDKGVKKSSAIQSLVGGFPVYRRGSIGQADNSDGEEEDESGDCSMHEDSSDDGLTSSMVMHGSHIFHGDNTFHFDSGSSSYSTQPSTESVYQQVTHSAAAAAGQELPDFCFDGMQFNHDYNFTGDYSLNSPSAMALPDSHWQGAMPVQQPTELEFLTEEYHLQPHWPTYPQLTPGSVPIDPLLSV